MRIPKRVLDLLVERESYRVCHLQTTQDFVRFCSERGVTVDDRRLAHLERLGLFLPLLRIYKFDVIHKIEFVEDGKRYVDHGILDSGEHWSGDTKVELAQLDFPRRYIESWRAEGYAWSPRECKSPRLDSLKSEPRRHEAYYSQFQILALDHLLRELTLRVQMEWSVADDGHSEAKRDNDRDAFMLETTRHLIERKGGPSNLDLIAALCQLISDRYYPKTQTDLRRITVPAGMGGWPSWDWFVYIQGWKASDVVELFDLTAPELKSLYEFVACKWSHIDPLERWVALTQFVAVDKRKQLKGDALHGQTIFEMAQMLRWLHQDAFEETLPEPFEATRTIFTPIPDVVPRDRPMEALDLVANDFRVNPKPQLVLFVEGQTEEAVIPLLFEQMFGASLLVYGIELTNLHGVNNATGSKKDRFSAVWRLIDYLHHHQTVAMVLMDREGLAEKNLGRGLRRALSTYSSNRKVTRPEYVKLWTLSFEFDNFYDWEIATVLTTVGQKPFTAMEVAACRRSALDKISGRKLLKIADLYRQKTNADLNKPEFGKALIDFMFGTTSKRKPNNRPIVRFLEKVAGLAAKNHQPDTSTIRDYNQLSGYLGSLQPGAVARRNKMGIRRLKKRRPNG